MTASLLTLPRQQVLSTNSQVQSGAKLYIYDNRTTTKVALFKDRALTVTETNPVIADAAGRIDLPWMQAGILVTVALKSATEEPIWSEDDVWLTYPEVFDGTAFAADFNQLDNVNEAAVYLRYAPIVSGISGLRLATYADFDNAPDVVLLRGSYFSSTTGDDAGGLFKKVRTAAADFLAADDGGTYVRTANNILYKRMVEALPRPENYGAYGDGGHNDQAEFDAIVAAHPSRAIDLSGKSFVLTDLPYGPTGDAALPILQNGNLIVDAVTYPMHGVGGCISAQDETQNQSTVHRVGMYVSERCRVRSDGSSPAGAFAASRCDVNGNGNAAIAGVYMDVFGEFHALGLASRYCEISGQRAVHLGNLMCRTFGVGGIEDYANRWDFTSGHMMFQDTPDAEAAETFYTAIVASAGCEIRGGSTNFIAASRGTYSTVTDDVTVALTLNGSRLVALGAQNATLIGDANFALCSRTTVVENANVNYSGAIASDVTTITSGVNQGAVIASFTSTLSGDRSAIIASDTTTASGERSSVMSSTSSAIASGNKASIIGCVGGQAKGANSPLIMASNTSIASADRAGVTCSRNIQNHTAESLALGRSTAAAISDTSANQNNSIRLEANGGHVRAADFLTTGLDFGEYQENFEPGIIAVGSVVVWDGGKKVRLGRAGDTSQRIAGVISAISGVIGNAHSFEWRGRYLRDEFGALILEPVKMVRWATIKEGCATEYDGRVSLVGELEIPAHATFSEELEPVESPDYDPSRPYEPPEKRPEEHSLVGKRGQVPTRVGGDVGEYDFVGPDGSRSSTPTRIMACEISKPYDPESGYAIAWCEVS